MRRGFAGVALLLASLGAAPSESGTLRVPRGRAPSIDGIVRAGEWKGAATRKLEGGGRIHYLHDGADLFVGLSDLPGSGWGYGAVMLGTPDTVLVLHASAQIGSAVYTARNEPGGRIWRPSDSTYTWKPGPRAYAEEGWMADVAPRDGARGREFRIARRTLGERRLAITYVVQTQGEASQAVRLPAALTIDRRVIDGWNPDSITIAPEDWLRIEWK